MPKTLKSACNSARTKLNTTKAKVATRKTGVATLAEAALESLVLYEEQIQAMREEERNINTLIKIIGDAASRAQTEDMTESDIIRIVKEIDIFGGAGWSGRLLRVAEREFDSTKRKRVVDILFKMLESLHDKHYRLLFNLNELEQSYQINKSRFR